MVPSPRAVDGADRMKMLNKTRFVADRTYTLLIPVLLPVAMIACGGDDADGRGGHGADSSSTGITTGSGHGGSGAEAPASVRVHLVPRAGVSGVERVNFALPLARGAMGDAAEL